MDDLVLVLELRLVTDKDSLDLFLSDSNMHPRYCISKLASSSVSPDTGLLVYPLFVMGARLHDGNFDRQCLKNYRSYKLCQHNDGE